MQGVIKLSNISFMPKGTKGFQKGHKIPLAIRNKISKANKGKHFSPKTEFKKGRKPSKEELKKKRKSMLGHKVSLETRRKIGLANKRRWKKYTKKEKQEVSFKISKSLIGIKRKPCKEITKKKISLANRDKGNGKWKGGVSFFPYNYKFNKRFKNIILKRDGYNNANMNLCVHHIDYNKLNSIIDNCCALCITCNLKMNRNKKKWEKILNKYILNLK